MCHSVPGGLIVSEEEARSLPRTITKHGFIKRKDKKSPMEFPPEVVVSTNLNVIDPEGYRLVIENTLLIF